MTEASLAHQSNCHDAPGHAHIDPWAFQLFRSLFRVVRQNLRDGVRELVLAPVRSLTKRLDLFQLLAPQLVNVFVECQESPLTGNCALRALQDNEALNRDYNWPRDSSLIP